MQRTRFRKGQLLVRYLEVPLITRKLTYAEDTRSDRSLVFKIIDLCGENSTHTSCVIQCAGVLESAFPFAKGSAVSHGPIVFYIFVAWERTKG